MWFKIKKLRLTEITLIENKKQSIKLDYNNELEIVKKSEFYNNYRVLNI